MSMRQWLNARWFVVVTVVVMASGLTTGCAEADQANIAFTVSPDGRQVVFVADDGDLYLLTLETKKVSSLGKTEESESSPRFSPDGRSIVYMSKLKGRKGNCLFVRPLDGQRRQITDDPNVADVSPSFSPDGRQVVFSRAYRHRPYSMGGWTWDDYDIALVDRDGTNFRRVTSENYYQAYNPCLTEEGKIIFCGISKHSDVKSYLFSVAADGSRKPELLTTPPITPTEPQYASWGSEPAVSADGNRLAFVSDRAKPFQYDIWVSGIDGADARPLGATLASRYNQQPMFLPGDKGVMFLANTNQSGERDFAFSLWTVAFDGTRPVRVAENTLFTDPMHWSSPEATPTPDSPGKP